MGGGPYWNGIWGWQRYSANMGVVPVGTGSGGGAEVLCKHGGHSLCGVLFLVFSWPEGGRREGSKSSRAGVLCLAGRARSPG